MLLIDSSNAENYLRQSGHLADGQVVTICELAGGVSNVVLLVSKGTAEPWVVLKQVREQLRVPEPWFCSIERIWREVDVLEICHRAITRAQDPASSSSALGIDVPRVLFVDRDNYLFAMSAAPQHVVWKAQLLSGLICKSTAAACGALLGTIHAVTWMDSDVESRLRDTGFFDALRVDPYYRHVARQHADVSSALNRLAQSLVEHPRCLVHGDFSPKNLLVHEGGLTLVDFEVGHFGDPAFDLGFFLSHLVLKAVRSDSGWKDFFALTLAFWDEYRRKLLPVCGPAELEAVEQRGIGNLAGCMLARVDGKSRVDYLDSTGQDQVRLFGRDLLWQTPKTWPEVIDRFLDVVRPAD